MLLTDDDLEEFIALWRDEFGETITRDRARERAAALLVLYELLVFDPSGHREKGTTSSDP
jgi:hypothetical protein